MNAKQRDKSCSNSWQGYFSDSAVRRQELNLVRFRGGIAEDARVDLDFGNNDYLGICRNESILQPLANATQLGSAASPALRGYHKQHNQLESLIAEWCGTEDALVFSSGYATNVGVLSCLAQQGDLILSDQLNHASLIDGCRLSRAQVQIFPHNDTEFLRKALEENRDQFARVLIATESVFSMDGDTAPLKEQSQLSKEFDCGLVVDEAHATGVFGSTGCGVLEDLSLPVPPLLKLGTLSKAIGASGGFAAGSKEAINHLVNHCRSYIYSTALPIPVAASACTAINILKSQHSCRASLLQASQNLRSLLKSAGWHVLEGASPIIPVIIGDEDKCLRLATHLRQQSIYVPAIRPPTVPQGTSRLRVSLNATHRPEDINRLLEVLASFDDLDCGN